MKKNTQPERVMAGPWYPMVDPNTNTGFLEGATFRDFECGCSMTGNGTIPHPLMVVQCPMHKAAAEMLHALRNCFDGSNGVNLGRALREAQELVNRIDGTMKHAQEEAR